MDEEERKTQKVEHEEQYWSKEGKGAEEQEYQIEVNAVVEGVIIVIAVTIENINEIIKKGKNK